MYCLLQPAVAFDTHARRRTKMCFSSVNSTHITCLTLTTLQPQATLRILFIFQNVKSKRVVPCTVYTCTWVKKQNSGSHSNGIPMRTEILTDDYSLEQVRDFRYLRCKILTFFFFKFLWYFQFFATDYSNMSVINTHFDLCEWGVSHDKKGMRQDLECWKFLRSTLNYTLQDGMRT